MSKNKAKPNVEDHTWQHSNFEIASSKRTCADLYRSGVVLCLIWDIREHSVRYAGLEFAR
ncbi:hypothetical protein N7465_011884 [Penicillium sp. CMV-2018d]|nr:hypothetical protein N7465_011884 [Penicillium sp. CMV-2018d]